MNRFLALVIVLVFTSCTNVQDDITLKRKLEKESSQESENDDTPQTPATPTTLPQYFSDASVDEILLISSSNNQIDYTEGIIADSLGNIYVTGRSQGTLDSIATNGAMDFFVQKYATDRSLQWTGRFGTGSHDVPRAIAINSSDEVYAVGDSNGDYAIIKYDSAGNLLYSFVHTLGGSGEGIFGAGTDSLGFLYILVQSDATSLHGTSAVGGGGQNCFLVKMDERDNVVTLPGDVIWTKSISTSADDGCRNLAVNEADEIYVISETTAALSPYSNLGDRDSYLLKFDTDGNEVWTRQIAGAGEDYLFGLHAKGNFIAVAGPTKSDYPGVSHYDAGASQDIGAHVYNRAGDLIWTKLIGENSNDEAGSLQLDLERNLIYISGFTDGSFDGHINQGSLDSYMLVLDLNNGDLLDTSFKAGSSIDAGRKLVYVPSQNVLVNSGWTNSTDGPFAAKSETSHDGFMTWIKF